MMMDWREIFKRYMTHVGRMEGVTFLHAEDWSPQEWAEIEAAAEEAEAVEKIVVAHEHANHMNLRREEIEADFLERGKASPYR